MDNVKCLNPWDGQSIRTYDASGVWHTLYASSDKSGLMRDSVVYCIDARNGVLIPELSHTVQAHNTGGRSLNTTPNVIYAVSMDGKSKSDALPDRCPALTAPKQSKITAVVYDSRGNGEGGVVNTLTGDHQNRITDYTAVIVERVKNET